MRPTNENIMNANRLPKRNYGLDNLKLAICLLVVTAHTMLPYTDLFYGWYFTPSLPGEKMSVNYLINTNNLLSMPIFFIVAGFFVPTSYDKQGFGTFIWKKTKRLLIPAIIMLAYCKEDKGGLQAKRFTAPADRLLPHHLCRESHHPAEVSRQPFHRTVRRVLF